MRTVTRRGFAGAETSVSPAEARAIAKEAYIYGFPMVDNYRIQYAYFVDRQNPEFKATWNQIVNIRKSRGFERRHEVSNVAPRKPAIDPKRPLIHLESVRRQNPGALGRQLTHAWDRTLSYPRLFGPRERKYPDP
jgi:hypothetical protein